LALGPFRARLARGTELGAELVAETNGIFAVQWYLDRLTSGIVDGSSARCTFFGPLFDV
jgi:hypothetical protein